MPNPWKDPHLQERMKNWIHSNPDRWYTARYTEIAAETSVSESTLRRHYPLLVAEVAKILPSEVLNRRREHGGQYPIHSKLSDEEVASIQELYRKGTNPLDIAYITGRSLNTVKKYDPNRKNSKKKGQKRD